MNALIVLACVFLVAGAGGCLLGAVLALDFKWARVFIPLLAIGILFVVPGLLIQRHAGDRDRVVDAQVCVNSGGIPYQASRHADPTCLHRKGDG